VGRIGVPASVARTWLRRHAGCASRCILLDVSIRAGLEPLGDGFVRAPVTLDFEHEDMALRVLFGLGDDVEIVKPKALRRKLGALAARVLAVTH